MSDRAPKRSKVKIAKDQTEYPGRERVEAKALPILSVWQRVPGQQYERVDLFCSYDEALSTARHWATTIERDCEIRSIGGSIVYARIKAWDGKTRRKDLAIWCEESLVDGTHRQHCYNCRWMPEEVLAEPPPEQLKPCDWEDTRDHHCDCWRCACVGVKRDDYLKVKANRRRLGSNPNCACEDCRPLKVVNG